jgi:hypothetical protein
MTIIKVVPMPGVAGPKGDTGAAGQQGEPGTNGLAGASAFQIAVGDGFVGSQSAWLASLVGAQGPQGNPGPAGDTGMTGASAYQVAVSNGFSGSESEWLDSLKGPQGDQGQSANTGDIEFNGNNITAHGDMLIGVDVVPGEITLSAYAGVNIATSSEFGLYVNGIDPDNKVLTTKDVTQTIDKLAYGSFYDQNSFGPYAANTTHHMSLESTDFSKDVHIGGIESSQIVMDKAGKFNIAFSAQFHQTNSSGIINIWLRKNGTDMPWTNTKLDVTSNNPYVVAAWNFFVSADQYDYFEIVWSSTSNSTVLEAISAGAHPAIPSVIVTVNQVGV